MSVRPAKASDHAAIRAVVVAAFGRDLEAEIVEGVRAQGKDLVELVAETDRGDLIGHILFSRMTCDPPAFIAGLGPLAVSPERQDGGAGTALAMAGVEACRELGCEAIVVLGHPTYYPRFGFSAEAARPIASPFAGRPSFMALALRPGALDAPIRIDYPAAFG